MELVNLIIANGPWSWIVLGLVLLGLELVVPGGILVWLGISGIITGLIAFIPGVSLPMQFVIFGALGLITVTLWLRYNRGREPKTDRPLLNQRAERFIGQEVMIDEPIKDGYGRVALGDTVWRIAGPDLAAGAKIRIVGADGAVLKVEPV